MKELNNNNNESILKKVVLVISEQLNQPGVLREDNFYDLGGDSLAAMKIKNELEDQLSIKVSIESIMLTETIGEFADDLALRVVI
ncbi:phosphopantetheine-binding protein [Bacillus mojavensis]|uniref:phosphopantetheine-binding protein n=1 Tax=Bacillus mojavensis subgroup TaxID=653388 RepID=UPI002DB88451|nr:MULTISPECIES: phosphopantetheine-binding protein [Bacillus mojavensis subgroup]MEC1614764.1 phosphopantetheine-binding protein [Bacillus mojavensis]MEC1646362.1 phosphopantetheine-binding protein [Bacillus halotolerans]MEC1690671.1 phosphopantetheine-binding protein [Bacillus mojavensis]